MLISPTSRLVVAAEGKGGVTLTLDAIKAARNVIISAGKPSQAGEHHSSSPLLQPTPRAGPAFWSYSLTVPPSLSCLTGMVATVLAPDSASLDHGLPVGLIRPSSPKSAVDWLLSTASAVELAPALEPMAGSGGAGSAGGDAQSLDGIVNAEAMAQEELRDALNLLQLQEELAAELGYDSVEELAAAMEEIENEEGGLEAFLSQIEDEDEGGST